MRFCAVPERARGARAAFGSVEAHKEALRDGRGWAWLAGVTLDLKLGYRMLVRYPVLTLVGAPAMAFAIAAGAGTFEAVKRATRPDLPLPGGERIVGFNYWDRVGRAAPARRSHPHRERTTIGTS